MTADHIIQIKRKIRVELKFQSSKHWLLLYFYKVLAYLVILVYRFLIFLKVGLMLGVVHTHIISILNKLRQED